MAQRRDDVDEVPRLPRGRGFKLSFPQLMRIAMVALALVAVLALMRPCAEGMSHFVTSFGSGSDAGAPAAPALDGGHFVEIKPGMSDEQIRRILSDAGP